MDVLMISPGYPPRDAEVHRSAGCRGSQRDRRRRPAGVVAARRHATRPESLRADLSFTDEERAVGEVLDALRGVNIDRVESMWEATMYLAARLRERIGAPGLDVARTIPYRDKESMEGGPAGGGDPGAARDPEP